MINNFSYYKGTDILNDDLRYIKKNYLNPYGYNLESNFKDEITSDEYYMKSKHHNIRKIYKNK